MTKGIALTVCTAVAFTICTLSCKSQEQKDAEAKAKIEALVPDVYVSVKDGVATLSGKMRNDAEKAAAADVASRIDGIKSVVNNTTIYTTPTLISAIVNEEPDDVLATSCMAVLREYPGVASEVKNGVIMLTGTIKKADWKRLKHVLEALHPKKIENNMTIK